MTDPNTTTPAVTNLDITEQFREAADLLEAQDAGPFRVRAYRQGASTLTQVDRSVAEIYERDGREGLEELEQAVHDGRLAEVEGVGERTPLRVRRHTAYASLKPASTALVKCTAASL